MAADCDWLPMFVNTVVFSVVVVVVVERPTMSGRGLLPQGVCFLCMTALVSNGKMRSLITIIIVVQLQFSMVGQLPQHAVST